MKRITDDQIDIVQDAVTFMRLAAQILSEGDVDDRKASEISWMLGRIKKRLEPIIELLEEIQFEQEHEAAGKPMDDVLEIGAEVLALWEKFAARRRHPQAFDPVENEHNGENS